MIRPPASQYFFIIITLVCCFNITLTAQNNFEQQPVSMSFSPLPKTHKLYHLLKKSGLTRSCKILQFSLKNNGSLPYIYTAKPILGIKTYNLQTLEQKMYKKGWGAHILMNLGVGASALLLSFFITGIVTQPRSGFLGGDIRPHLALLSLVPGSVLVYLLYKIITNPRKMEKRKKRLRDTLEYYILNPNQQIVIPSHKSINFLLFCSKKSDLDNLIIPYTTERVDLYDRTTPG